MAALESSPSWPPEQIVTDRLVLREPEARDRSAVIDLLSSSEVGTFVGGARPRAQLESALPAVPQRRPGLFVVEVDGAMAGIVTLDRRDPDRLGHLAEGASEVELGYLSLPAFLGQGLRDRSMQSGDCMVPTRPSY